MSSPAAISLERQLRAANRNLHLAHDLYFGATNLSADEWRRRQSDYKAALHQHDQISYALDVARTHEDLSSWRQPRRRVA